ncbi:peptidylprolyl isomerase [Patescibacteria group bacterium]
MNIKEILYSTILLIILLGLGFFLIKGGRENMQQNQPNSDLTQEIPEQKTTSAPEMQLEENVNYSAKFTTSRGEFTVDLYESLSPITVNNFVFLAKEGLYDGLIFHRIIADFMIQGGDPLGNGTGGPGYQFEDEINDKKLVKGSLAMANSGPNTNGSQFFIVTAEATPWLDGLHTNFGEVTEGLDVVMEISKVETGPGDKPLEDVVVQKIEIIEL